ncbi:CDP-diacylglycerol--inositol 3-phosphatidyltransferase-like [Anneissia japonica]|uniref:CDP-diacylglycerol--inositol 3-phosphatidyltransferase-like n=1 Tax=Anneissia japonica TaxID=1529436 RepID=UPI0014256A1E|nr:CDP-diacylglycerol--inositol 3-phosphatidyltransferase-like [Anneissia japonica]
MSDEGEAKRELSGNVSNCRTIYLYVPNIIGYIRILLLGISSRLLYLDWYLEGTFIYIVFIVLDFIDGYYARKLNQCTVFGAFFDTMIDVLGDTMMLMHIARRNPSYFDLIQFQIFIHLSCGFLSTSAHCLCGSVDAKSSTWTFLRFFYDQLLDYILFAHSSGLVAVHVSSYTMGPKVPLLPVQLVPLMLLILCPFSFVWLLSKFVRICEALMLYQDIETKKQHEKFI